MTESDLTRPVVEIRDFETGKLMFEIYTYGEENVVIPIEEEEKESGVKNLAKQRVKQAIRSYDPKCEISFVDDNRVSVKVDNDCIPRLIGKQGSNISKIEEDLGIHINIEPKVATTGREVDYNLDEVGNNLVFRFNKNVKDSMANIYVDGDYLLSATVGKKYEIKINKSSEIGKNLINALVGKKDIKVLVV